MLKDCKNRIPLERVKSFIYIYLKEHPRGNIGIILKRVHNFLRCNNIIKTGFTRHETTLLGTYEMVNDTHKPISMNFRNNFTGNIVERDRFKINNIARVVFFRNEDNISFTPRFK